MHEDVEYTYCTYSDVIRVLTNRKRTAQPRLNEGKHKTIPGQSTPFDASARPTSSRRRTAPASGIVAATHPSTASHVVARRHDQSSSSASAFVYGSSEYVQYVQALYWTSSCIIHCIFAVLVCRSGSLHDWGLRTRFYFLAALVGGG